MPPDSRSSLIFRNQRFSPFRRIDARQGCRSRSNLVELRRNRIRYRELVRLEGVVQSELPDASFRGHTLHLKSAEVECLHEVHQGTLLDLAQELRLINEAGRNGFLAMTRAE